MALLLLAARVGDREETVEGGCSQCLALDVELGDAQDVQCEEGGGGVRVRAALGRAEGEVAADVEEVAGGDQALGVRGGGGGFRTWVWAWVWVRG